MDGYEWIELKRHDTHSHPTHVYLVFILHGKHFVKVELNWLTGNIYSFYKCQGDLFFILLYLMWWKQGSEAFDF